MSEAPAGPYETEKIARLGLAMIVAIYLLLNVLTAARSPTVGEDEVIFTEPAINLAHGHGFTVEGWNGERGRFWTGNAPLYSLLLSVWLRAAPFTPAGVRTLNYLLALGAALAVALAARRMKLITPPNAAILVAALLFSYSVSFSYRSGRYEITALLVVSLAFLAASIGSLPLRLAGMLGAGALFFWSGFQLPVYALVLSGVVLAALRRRAIVPLAALWTGIACGAAALLLFYRRVGVLDDFIATIGRHSIVHGAGIERTAYNTLSTKWTHAVAALAVDPVNLLSTALLAFAFFAAGRQAAPRVRSAALGALAISFVVPTVFALLYSYPMYYAWTVVVPVAIGLAAVRSGGESPACHHAATAALLLIIGTGLPLRVALTLLEWRTRDYAPVRALVSRNVGKSDRVYVDFPAYYPAKEAAAEIELPLQIYPPYRMQLTEEQRAGINVLILGEETRGDRAAFPGLWRKIDALRPGKPSFLRRLRPGFGARPYELEVWRRAL